MADYDFIYNYLASRADDKIVARGRGYYRYGYVEKLTLSPEGKFVAEVAGSEDDNYEVFIEVKDGAVQDFGCDCPYDWGDVCKHLIAVALAIQDGKFKQAQPRLNEQGLYELLLDIDPDELLDFLADYAKRDSDFEDALRVRFEEPDEQTELAKLGGKIDAALEDVSRYGRGSRWYDSSSVDTSGISFEIEQRAKQGHVLLAFKSLETMYRKLIEVFEEQEECEVADEVEDCLRQMREVADQAIDPADQAYIFECCISLAALEDGKDYGAEYEDKLLAIAAKFVTQDNLQELEEAIALYEEEWRAEDFALIRLTIIRRLEGEQAADAFIAANLKHEKIREIACDIALQRQDLAQAECLCQNAAGGELIWLHRLFSVHELMNDPRKMIDTSRRIVLRGDLNYYDKLKAQLWELGEWEAAYPALLEDCTRQLSYINYMKILRDEREYDLLFEQLQVHTEEVYVYGKFLAEEYEGGVRSIYYNQIRREAENAYGRDSYQTVCRHIENFAQAGFAPVAMALIEDFMQLYKRKPAFADELGQTEKRIK